MQQGSIVGLHIARVKGTPSHPVQEATAIANCGLEGDRSCIDGNPRQVLVLEKETLDRVGVDMGLIKENITTAGLDLSEAKEGQVISVGGGVTLKVVGPCIACSKMDAVRDGLQEELNGCRGTLTMVVSGGPIKVGAPISLGS